MSIGRSRSAGDKQEVHDFWNRNVCQADRIEDFERGTPEFFAAVEALRYRYHYHLLPLFDRLAQTRPGARLLEVGCGMATDLVQLARRGFEVAGVDLTEAGIDLARERFALYDLSADLRVADAENLPFDESTFDIVYSFGVLHHTPDTARSIREVHRVLKPGGLAVVMLYHRHSLNYFAHAVLKIPFDGSKNDPAPVERAYSRAEARRLFAPFSRVQVDIDYLFGTGWGAVNRFMPTGLHRWLGRRIGWHLMIEATK